MKNKRQYALFEKQDGKWVRISQFAWSLESARRIFQGELLAPALGQDHKGPRSLRPV